MSSSSAEEEVENGEEKKDRGEFVDALVIVNVATGARRRIAARPDDAGDKRRRRAILSRKMEIEGEKPGA